MVTGISRLSETSRVVLQAVYDHVRERGSWPTYTVVDLYLDRSLGIEDTQAALAAVPNRYMRPPWQQHGYYDNDEVRLTLRGVHECKGGPEDLLLLVRFVEWLTRAEQVWDPKDGTPVATSIEFAGELGVLLEPPKPERTKETTDSADVTARTGQDEPPSQQAEGHTENQVMAEVDTKAGTYIEDARAAVVRVRTLSDLVRGIWVAAGHPPDEPWRWRLTLDRRGLRPYRQVHSVAELLDRVEPEQPLMPTPDRDAAATTAVGPQPDPGTELDVLLTLLRPEIADTAAALLRADLFDEAIFAAFRRVEHELQQRTGLAGSIGDTLIAQAFRDKSDPIRISAHDKDAERLIELFSGSIGLLKGDRSHKDKPALPCRSRRECLRQLAQASVLLDLLDRDIAVAPTIRGYNQSEDVIELWVDRASAQSQVWLGEHRLTVRAATPSALIVDRAGVPPGEHDLFLIDGTRHGPITTVSLIREPNLTAWYRVAEVNIPLFVDATSAPHADLVGVRLTIREDGLLSERIFPTSNAYRVGDYVTWVWDTTRTVGPLSARLRPCDPLRRLWEVSCLFAGEPMPPVHEPRLARITLEPATLLLHVGNKVPIRALGHYTDGIATWSEPLDNPNITTDDSKIAHRDGGVVFAKQCGETMLRIERDGRYASAVVHIAAHPRGTLTDFLTGLPSVVGLAWTADGLVISARSRDLWRVGKDGKFTLIAGIPLQPPAHGGTDTIAASADGALAVRLVGHGDLLILDPPDSYRRSHWVHPPGKGVIMAMTWDGPDLIVTLDTGVISRVCPDDSTETVFTVPQVPTCLSLADGTLLVLTGGHSSELWRIPLVDPSQATNLTLNSEVNAFSAVASINDTIYMTEFHGGRLVRLDGTHLTDVCYGLDNPTALAGGTDGSIYIAEFGRGAVRRMLP